jgi:radical SAM superfamily enzyme YgiQ (UPF0313 family)
MKYEGIIIRPPSEARSLLLQVTVGCSHNKCTFCGTYKGVRFRIKTDEEIREDVFEAARRFPYLRRIFLCDGDALIIPQERLVKIFQMIRENLHRVERIGLYGNAKSILRKTIDNLRELKELGLGIVYLGVETGNEEILAAIRKGVSYSQMVEAGRRVKEAGITLSITVLLGIGGKEKSVLHALDTARIISDIDPDYCGALTVMLIPGTPLYDDLIQGRFELPDPFGYLQELGIIISHINCTNCFFTSNHASNYLPLRLRLPQDKEPAVAAIQQIIQNRDSRVLRPEFMRGL